MGTDISVLLFADDITITAPSEVKLQIMLNCVLDWCLNWRLNVDEEKTQIVHFRPPAVQRTLFQFTYGEHCCDKQLQILGILVT